MATTPQLLYPHLRGDLDTSPELMKRLELIAAGLGLTFTITSGGRTLAEQRNVKSTYGPKAAATPNAPHVAKRAADVTVNGVPIWQHDKVAPELRRNGLGTFAGGEKTDPVHVELKDAGGGTSLGDAVTNGAKALPGIGPLVAGADALNVGDEVAGAAGAAAKATAGALVGLIVDAIGRDGARLLLSIALVLVALVAVAAGTARALGLRAKALDVASALPLPAGKAAAVLKGAS